MRAIYLEKGQAARVENVPSPSGSAGMSCQDRVFHSDYKDAWRSRAARRLSAIGRWWPGSISRAWSRKSGDARSSQRPRPGQRARLGEEHWGGLASQARVPGSGFNRSGAVHDKRRHVRRNRRYTAALAVARW